MFRNLLLSIISGLIFFLSWPPSGFPFLIFFAFIPIFIVLEKRLSLKTTFLYSLLAFVVWNTLTTYWIWNASPFGCIAAILVNSLLMSAVLVLTSLVRASFDQKRAWWAFVVFWLAFEYIHHNWDLTWPWLTLGNVFSSYPSVVQWYEFTGVLGGSLWVLITNIFVFYSWKRKKVQFLIILILTFPVFCSLFCTPNLIKEERVKIVMVQPNIDPYSEKFDGISSIQQIKQFVELAKSEIDSTTELLIGPETAIVRGVWEDHFELSSEISVLNALIEEFPQLNIIIGATTYKMYKDSSEFTHTSRKFQDSEYRYDIFNSAIFLNSSTTDVYHKSKLVQGVEFIPFDKVLKHLDFLTIKLGGASGSLGTQEYREVFNVNNINVAPIICYESIFGEYVTSYVRLGARLFTIITNDGWWKNTSGYQQHLHYASLRAIECRRPIARCANTGISAFIKSDGQIVSPSQWDREDVLKTSLYVNDEVTFYVKYGDLIGRLSSFLSLFFILFLLARRKKQFKSS